MNEPYRVVGGVSDKMSRSDWGRVSKVVGFICIPLILGLVIYVGTIGRADSLEKEAANRAALQRDNAEYHIRWVCSAPEANPECTAKAREASIENARQEEDLGAQKLSAWWGRVMGIAALIGMWVSLIGIWLVWTTFRATKEANHISTMGFRDQLRPYLVAQFAGPLHMEIGELLIVEVSLINSGQTPALNVDGNWTMGIFPADSGPDFPELMEIGEGGCVVGRDRVTLITKSLGKLTPTIMRSLKSGKNAIFALGKFRYQDIYGAWHVFEFDYVSDNDIESRRMNNRRKGAQSYDYPLQIE